MNLKINKEKPFLVGAVAYDAKVVTIWEGFKEYFRERDFPFDFVLFSNYETQVESHLAGRLHAAWNSPLAWIEARRLAERRGRQARAGVMRDTDQDLTSVIIVRSDSGINTVADLKGKTVATGALDSPQATLIPLMHLHSQGLEPGRDFEVRRFDIMVGKHGDHVGGERDAVEALMGGEVDAACILDANHLVFGKEGTIMQGASRILTQSAPFDHCNFTLLEDVDTETEARFSQILLGMSYDDPKVRPLLDLEGLKQWKEGRTTGYTQLEQACDTFGVIDPWLDANA